MRTIFRALAVGLTVCTSACSEPTSQERQPTTPAVSAQPATPRVKIDASVMTRKEVQELIKSHAGKVVVLDLWALW